jgi:hypothetical protein
MPNLTNSTTKVLTASLVPLAPATVRGSGLAVPNSAFVQQLRLQSGEVNAVKKALTTAATAKSNQITKNARMWSVLRQYEGTPLGSQLPPLSALNNVATNDLVAFGKGLIAIRQQAVQNLNNASAVVPRTAQVTAAPAPGSQGSSSALSLLNSAVVATKALNTSSVASPIGMLNLERLEMTPAGIEQGALIATVPLAPKERTFVVQKEWSVTTQEFTSIVTDSLENYSETGVTENTQLAQSTASQVAHNNQYNVTASASGGVNFVVASGSASASTAVTNQDQNSQSANTSRQNAVATTRNASARVRSSHKTTISTTSVEGTSEATTRMLENPSATDPMRIDYFSLMCKWYVALYRYGARLTYDVTVPEPGAAFRQTYGQLADLQAQATQAFTFNLQYSDITQANYQQLATQYGAQVSPPPQEQIVVSVGGQPVTGINTSESGWFVIWPLSYTVPDGYQIDSVVLNGFIGDNDSTGDKGYNLNIVGYNFEGPYANADGTWQPPYGDNVLNNVILVGFLSGFTGSGTITCVINMANPAEFTFYLYTVPTSATIEQWQSTAYSALFNAAQSAFYTQQQAINAQITALQNQINNVDTLTLRREENDEIMKCVLIWLLGPGFAFMSPAAKAAFISAAILSGSLTGPEDLVHGVGFTGETSVSPSEWNALTGNEEVVSFINQAIEWENVVFFLYSYFWDEPLSWDFIRQIQHDDKTRQAFLRSGSARVVLTVRPGWETAWAYFVVTGQTSLPSPLPAHPYLTIAQQIADYDSTNYPGIPPANPNGGGLIDDDTPQFGTTSATKVGPSNSQITIPVANTSNVDGSGFAVGATAIIDNWDSGVQETQTITAVTASPPSISVQMLQYAHSVASGPFPVVQSGAKGVLIGEWFEYTPTSGTDIAVSSNLGAVGCIGVALGATTPTA